jgi:xanthine dehydrogenase accessory factor
MTLTSESPDWARIAEAESTWAAPVMVTVVNTSGSTPRKVGARMLVDAQGDCPEEDADLPHPEGTVGGGAVEAQAIRLAFEAWRAGGSLVRRTVLGAEMGMCCGGTMTLMAQPLIERPTLIVFGLGHVGAAVARLSTECGFRVVGVDGRDELTEQASPWLDAIHQDFDPETLAALPDGDHVHALIVTHDHGLDQELVEALINRPFASLQMLGSQRKALRCRTRLEAQGLTPERIESLHSPAGYDIDAETPAEIAVALVAYLVKQRRG